MHSVCLLGRIWYICKHYLTLLILDMGIDKQKALRRDCIYNIENRSRNRGFRRLLTYGIIILYFDIHR